MVAHMAGAAANTYGAPLTLVLNGYGHYAMKLARSLFEVDLTVLRPLHIQSSTTCESRVQGAHRERPRL
jgi:hypothetical protein